ncbi:MAG: hypothetical protein Q4G26_09530 [Paracoccus sp. (in: a-proteobacteria)]|nr:hypothetical protein [Paracoccus sp. (in: a-proteobacteria)]
MKTLKLPPPRVLGAYALGFLGGIGVAWLVLWLGIIEIFRGGSDWLANLLTVASPLAGIAVFLLMFGWTGYWRGWRFWVISVPLVYAILGLGLLLAGPGGLPFMTVLIGAPVLLFLTGIWGLALSHSPD